MKLSTDAIDSHGYFDPRYTCDVDNSSPELHWEEVPNQAESFALIAEDPDTPQGIFIHWVVYQIPKSLDHLPAGMPPQDLLPNGIRQGLNSSQKLGYLGPCPRRGDDPHHYFFRLYALSQKIELPPRASAEQVKSAIQPYILDEAKVMGKYQRPFERAG